MFGSLAADERHVRLLLIAAMHGAGIYSCWLRLPPAAAADTCAPVLPLPCGPVALAPPHLQGTTTAPASLQPGQQPLPPMSEASTLMNADHVRSLAAAVPARYRQARWTLLYATARDGISLPTLMRAAHRRAPTVLVVRDFDR